MASKVVISEQEFIYLQSVYKAEDSFYEFVKQAWEVVEGGNEFVDGWHIKAICEHLEAGYRREILRLLMNIPPRCMKTTLTLIMFPAWVFIKNPSERFLTSSYTRDLSKEAARKCKELILSPWYQERWGHLFSLSKDQREKANFTNNKGGAYIATSTNGTTTGRGGTFLIADDPNDTRRAESVAKKKESIDWFSRTWSTRGNKPSRTVRIVMQQRVDMEDISGFVINNDYRNAWVKLILPMEFEVPRCAETVPLPFTKGKKWKDPRTKEGQLLWPEHMTASAVEDLKIEMHSPTAIAGQLQQRPTAAEGDCIKRAWFRWWKESYVPDCIQVIQSWDTALSDKKTACYSACTTWGLFYDEKDNLNVILLSAYRGRISYPELRSRAKKLAADYRDDGSKPITPDGKHVPDYVLVEEKSSGISLLQDFNAAGINSFGFNPDKFGNKLTRVHVITHLLEGGRVWVAAEPPNYTRLFGSAAEFVESCVSFPAERDYTDSMVQVLLKLNIHRMLTNPNDGEFLGEFKKTRRTPLY